MVIRRLLMCDIEYKAAYCLLHAYKLALWNLRNVRPEPYPPRDVVIAVRQAASPYSDVECDVSATTTSAATIAFTAAPSSNQYRVTVIG